MSNPDNRNRLSRFWYDSVWDTDKREFLGRTKESWGKIGFFYLIFYSCLAGFFAIWLAIFLETLDPRIPRFHGEGSIIGTNPGIGFIPHADIEKNLLWFSSAKPHTYKPYVDDLTKFLDNYDSTKQPERTFIQCEGRNSTRPGNDKVCRFDAKREFEVLTECKQEQEYGYKNGKPCLVLKLNKVWGWEPKQYKSIDDVPKVAKKNWNENFISVTCEGMNAADKENIGPVDYAPKGGFPLYFYPYRNTDYYIQPLVMVHFVNPTKGVLINVECKIWLDNVRHDRHLKQSLAVFELIVD